MSQSNLEKQKWKVPAFHENHTSRPQLKLTHKAQPLSITKINITALRPSPNFRRFIKCVSVIKETSSVKSLLKTKDSLNATSGKCRTVQTIFQLINLLRNCRIWQITQQKIVLFDIKRSAIALYLTANWSELFLSALWQILWR